MPSFTPLWVFLTAQSYLSLLLASLKLSDTK